MRDFLRRVRGWLTGLNAISTRFDLLQNRIDSLLETSRFTNETLTEIARKYDAESDRRRLTEQALADRFDASAQRSDQRFAEVFGGLQAQFDVIERCIAELIDKPERTGLCRERRVMFRSGASIDSYGLNGRKATGVLRGCSSILRRSYLELNICGL